MAAKAAMAKNALTTSLRRPWASFGNLISSTLTAPVVKMTQNSEGGYDYNKWSVTERDFLQFLGNLSTA